MVIRLKNAHVLDGEKFLLRDLELPCMEPRSYCGSSVSVLELDHCFYCRVLWMCMYIFGNRDFL